MQDYSINQFLALAKTPSLDIEICDVTLRDGEQMPGVVFRPDEKLDIAMRLNEIGVEVIEAGFPVVSQGGEECCPGNLQSGLGCQDRRSFQIGES